MHLFVVSLLLLILGGGQHAAANPTQCQDMCADPNINHGNAIAPDLDHPVFHASDYNQLFHNETNVAVQCDNSYWFTGTNQRIGTIRCTVENCEARWDPSEKEACRAAECSPVHFYGGVLKHSTGRLDLIPCTVNSKDLDTPIKANKSACLVCHPGFKIMVGDRKVAGPIRVWCDPHGKWDAPFQCKNQIDCQRPSTEDLSRRFIQILTFDARNQMEFECINDDLLMFGDPVVRCQNGNWSLPWPVCRFKWSCLLSINNGRVMRLPTANRPPLGPWARHNDYGVALCDPSYIISAGDCRIKCKKGNWDPQPICSAVASCPTLSVQNGRVSTPATAEGTVVDMYCNDRYRKVSGSTRVTCKSGNWSGSALACQRGYGFQDPPQSAPLKKCGSFCQTSGDNILVPASDVNGDGFADLICHKASGRIHMALNDQRGGFICPQNPASGIENGWCRNRRYKATPYVADFDGDKRADLLCHKYVGGQKDARVRNAVGNSYSNPQGEEGLTGWCTHNGAEFHVADFNADNRADLLCHDNRTGTKWLAKGSLPCRSFAQTQRKELGWCWHTTSKLYVADSNGDGAADIYCHDDSGNLWTTLGVRSNYTVQFSFGRSHTIQISQSFCKGNTRAHMPRFHLMDFNGDGTADLYCHRTNDSEENCTILGKTTVFSNRDTCRWRSSKDYCNGSGDLLIFGKFLQRRRDDILCIRNRQTQFFLIRNYGV